MNVLPKRNVLSEDNALFRRAKPALFDIGCRGILAASRRRIMITGVTSLLMMPLAWITSIILRLPHVALVTGIWWVFRDELGEAGIPANPALALGIVVVFYKQIYDEFIEIFLHLLILVSGGRAIRWLCAGYIENAPFRQGLFSKDEILAIFTIFMAAMPNAYQRQYDRFMDLYLNSNDPKCEQELTVKLNRYKPEDLEPS